MNTAKKTGRGKAAKNIALISAMETILREIQPASVRAVCYRLFVAGLMPSMAKKHVTATGKQLKEAREDGQIPWEWIVDETREAERAKCWSNPESIINAAVAQYRKDYWADQPNRVEVWSEKGTIRGTIAPVLKKCGVAFRVLHGYGSATSLHDAAEESLATDKPMTVLYLGDHDPSGMSMSVNDIPKRIKKYGGMVELKRIALDAKDVAPGTSLPSFEAETKKADSRYKWFVENYGPTCWELDALPPNILRRRVEEEIFSLIDLGPWNKSVSVERAEVESMGNFLQAWKTRSICGLAHKCSNDGRGAL